VEAILLQLVTAASHDGWPLLASHVARQQVAHSDVRHLVRILLLHDPLILKRRADRLIVFAQRVNIVLHRLHFVRLQNLSLGCLIHCGVSLLDVWDRGTVVLKAELAVVNHSLGCLDRPESAVQRVASLAPCTSNRHESLFHIIREPIISTWSHCIFIVGIVFTVALHNRVFIAGTH